MAELLIRNLTRRFGQAYALHEVSLAVESGEFFVLLGPSGCGKSTLLRLIAGLDQPDGGQIEIAPARDGKRGTVAMVFQNYALYPHMTAFDNIAFPLKLMRLGRAEIERRVAQTARLAGLRIELGRHPAELSGGERQRVALARALVREPQVILMDEPLSNLDAQLRASLRAELKDFQRRTARTVIYVTHDQLEALTLADRLAVMRAGRVVQLGAPPEVYARPANQFVASFVGQPPMNLLACQATADRAGLVVGESLLDMPPPAGARDALVLGIRPEDLSAEPVAGRLPIEVTIERVEFAGGKFLTYARLGEARLLAELPAQLAAGSRQSLYVDLSRLHFFDSNSGERLG